MNKKKNMNVIEAISTRRSVLSYTEELITQDKLEELIRLGTFAATGSNMQPWGFVIVQGKERIAGYNEEVKAELLANLDKYPHLQQYQKGLENPGFSVLNNASNMILIYGSPESYYYKIDCTLAAANIMLAGREMGIESCWIGFGEYYFNSPGFKAAQNVPKEYDLVCVLTVGYPAKPVTQGPTRKDPLIFK
jgi:nitroreductase